MTKEERVRLELSEVLHAATQLVAKIALPIESRKVEASMIENIRAALDIAVRAVARLERANESDGE